MSPDNYKVFGQSGPNGSQGYPGFATYSINVVAGPVADLGVTNKVKKVSATKHKYSIKVTNKGPDTATSLTIVNKLPKNYKILSIVGNGASCGTVGLTVTCTLASLASAATQTIVISANPNGATGKDCATVSAATGDPVSKNNKACVTVPLSMQ